MLRSDIILFRIPDTDFIHIFLLQIPMTKPTENYIRRASR